MGVEEIGAEQGAGNVGQDKLVVEGDVGKIEVSGRRAVSLDPRPVGGAEGTRALRCKSV